VLDQDEYGNITKGGIPHRIDIKSSNTLVFSDKMVVTIGVDDLIIVQTDDAILICHKERSQDVKKVVEQLKEQQLSHYL
jgi:mannose-1-phosphate guanylyltransferase